MSMSADYRRPPALGDASARPKKGARKPLQWALTLLSLALLVVIIWRAAPALEESSDALRRIAPGWFVAAMGLEIIALGALAQVYRVALRALGKNLPYPQALDTSMGAFTVSRVVPGGGAVGAAFAARRLTHFGTSGAVATATVLLASTTLMVTLAVVVALAAVVLWATGTLAVVWLVLLASPTLLVVLTVVGARLLWRSPPRRAQLQAFAQRVARRLHIDLDAWRVPVERLTRESHSLRRLAPVVAWSAINWLTDAAALWMVFLGLGQQLKVSILLVGYGAANIATAIPITPGGLGVVEAGTAGAFAALGVPAAPAVVAVIGYRVMSYWLPVAAGVAPYLRAVRAEKRRTAVVPEEGHQPSGRPVS